MAIETLGAALRQLNRLWAGGTIAGFSDAQLLERFVAGHDAAAFEALVAHHGPMVLGVCRGILKDPNDAEDAFQATFLILVKKSSTLRRHDALGPWLYQVAHRVAIRANAAAARRRACERRAGQMAATSSTSGPSAPDERLQALHEEIARLPEKLRRPVILCDLQSVPQNRAAGELRLSERTLQRRLSEGRERLKARLIRRGLAPEGAVLGSAFLREARIAVPPAWVDATVRAGLAAVNPSLTAGVVSAHATELTREVLGIMLLQKVTLTSAVLLAAGLLAGGGTVLISLGQEAPKGAATRPARAGAAVPQPKPAAVDTDGTFPVRGRVIDPDGKPVAGAEVSVRYHGEAGATSVAARQQGLVAVTDRDGRFHFGLDKASSEASFDGGPGWRKAQIAAAAPGFAPAWVEAGDLVKGGEVALRLVRDDVPIRGRVLDSQGRPVAGVAVRIRVIGAARDGVDLDAMLASGEVAGDQVASWYGLGLLGPPWQADPVPHWPGGRNAWTTGADGRFEVRGIGRHCIARLNFHGGGVADGTLDVMARATKAPPKARRQPVRNPMIEMLGREAAFKGTYPQGTQLVGATFDYIAVPTKPFTGVVRLKGSGKPVEGAVVRCADPATHTAVAARTDAAGRFRLDGVPKGEFYQISLNPRPGIDRFLAHHDIVDDTEGLKPIEVAIEVPTGVIVTGRLVDNATGRRVLPSHVAYIKAPDNAGPEEAALGFSRLDDTTFGLTIPPGLGMIAATAAVSEKDDPYVCARLKMADRGKGIGDFGGGETISFPLSGYHTYRYIDVPAGAGPVAVDLELARGLSREGRLTGPDRRPIVGVTAYGLNARWGGTQTLDRGSTFEVRGLEPGHPRLVIFTHKARKLVGAIVLKDEDLKSTTPLEVQLGPAGTITGRIVDEDGHPLAGAKLNVTMFELGRSKNLPTGAGTLWPSDETFTADAQGRFRVEGFVPGVQTDVSIEAPNQPPSYLFGGGLDSGDALRSLTLDSGEVRDLGDVKARKRPQ